MFDKIFEKKIITPPWPIYVGNKFFKGTKVTKLINCSEDCIKELKGNGSHICNHGLSHIFKTIEGVRLIVSGVYIHNSQKSQKFNRKYKSQKASLRHINNWMLETQSKIQALNEISNNIAKDKFDQFHEFAKWANEINFYASKLIDSSKNGHITGFDAANEYLKSLYKTSVMLLDSLNTSSIYFNPASASFGNKRPTDIYSMIHKISLVLSHSKMNNRKAKIPIHGIVKNKHLVYESFKIIPLSFIQNALKYRKANDVEITFEETEKSLTMNVISYGDLIPENDLTKLFDRGYRASSAVKSKIEGNGLGLYVAKIVADAHDFELEVKSSLFDQSRKLAKNIFSVFIH